MTYKSEYMETLGWFCIFNVLLQKYRGEGKKIIVAMSAASNVTGIQTDTEDVAELIMCHVYLHVQLFYL